MPNAVIIRNGRTIGGGGMVASANNIEYVNEELEGVNSIEGALDKLTIDKADKEDVYGTNDEYLASTIYAIGDSVIYNKMIFTCTQACSGETPSEESEYWLRKSSKSFVSSNNVISMTTLTQEDYDSMTNRDQGMLYLILEEE